MLLYDKLSLDNLFKLIHGEIDFLIVNNFIDENLCRILSKKIFDAGYQVYSNAKSIGRIGMSLYETEGDTEKLKHYYNISKDEIDYMRKLLYPYANPIDTVRCMLDEIWPQGANLARFHKNSAAFVGLSRILEPGIYFLAHHDIVQKDLKNNYIVDSILKQLAVNVYLQMPTEGGELEYWNREMKPTEFDELRQESYGINAELLGIPDYTIKPSIGDLFIFNSKKMHAINPPSDINRLSLSFFMGFRGTDIPLIFWS